MPSLSIQELESGRALTELLFRANPRLTPDKLGSFVPAYKNFIPMRKAYGLWSSLETLPRVMKHYFQYDKVALLISGIAAGGKDAVREEIERISPGLLFKLVTGTSRKPREGEVDGKEYYFFNDPATFQTAVESGAFIEWVQQGKRFYGLPKQSLQDALTYTSPVICSHVEMSAWPKVEEYLAAQTNVKTFVLKLFVLPYMNFAEYRNWLSQRRDDVSSRLLRTGWEIAEAPKKADFIVTNRIREDKHPLTYTAQAVVNHSLLLLSSHEGFSSFPTPFSISPGIAGVENVVHFHDNVV